VRWGVLQRGLTRDESGKWKNANLDRDVAMPMEIKHGEATHVPEPINVDSQLTVSPRLPGAQARQSKPEDVNMTSAS
jgi:hypothetical protein